MKKIIIIISTAVVIFLGLLAYNFLRFSPGGGGTIQTAPDAVKTGEPSVIKLELSVWGAGGPIKGRYKDVIFYYRLVGEPAYKTIQSEPVPETNKGELNNKYELYTFTIPGYPKGTNRKIEYYFEMKFDGHLSHIDGLKKIEILN